MTQQGGNRRSPHVDEALKRADKATPATDFPKEEKDINNDRSDEQEARAEPVKPQ